MMIRLLMLIAAVLAGSSQAVTINCVDEGGGVVRIDYDASGEAARPIAFALDMTVNNGATIDAIQDYKSGDSTAADPGFGIYPGSITFNPDGNVADWGAPDINGAGRPGMLGGLGTSGVTIGAASRYANAAAAPLMKDMLFRIVVNPNGAATANLTVAANTSLGGVVLESATAATVTSPGLVISFDGSGNTPPAITSVTATPQSISDNQTSALNVVAGDPDSGPAALSYQWVVPAGQGTVDNPASQSPVFTPASVVATTTVTLTVNVFDGLATASGTVPITVSPAVGDSNETIQILAAWFRDKTNQLYVKAKASGSSDEVLTVVGYGQMNRIGSQNRYEYMARGVADPGGSVTVTSSRGGSATAQVRYLSGRPDEVEVQRAVYDRTNQQLYVRAVSTAMSNAVLTIDGLGTMTWNPETKAHELTASGLSSPPSELSVTSTLGGADTATVKFINPQRDRVVIRQVQYDQERKRLYVAATSSSQPVPVLTLVGYGKMPWKKDLGVYEYRAGLPAPPDAPITVSSSFGGSAVRSISGSKTQEHEDEDEDD